MNRILYISIIVFISIGGSSALAQPEIPERCFVNGEIDCSRPGCQEICELQPTPGYESSPIVPPPSGLEKDMLEEGAMRIAGRPRIFMPFHEDPVVLEIPDKSKPDEEEIECDGIETDEVKDIKWKLEGHRHWVKITSERVGNSFFDQYENYVHKQNDENLVDSFEYQLAKQMCYRSGDRCIRNGDKETKKLLNEYRKAVGSLRFARNSYYEYIYNCTDAKLDCESPANSWKFECHSFGRSCLSYTHDVENLKRAEEKKNQVMNALKKLECTGVKK